MRSPVDSSMSISRPAGAAETWLASSISPSVVLPIADTVPTTRLPLSRMATMRLATFLILSASATEEPPNFITTVSKSCSACAAMTRIIVAERGIPRLSQASIERRPSRARPSVTSSANSRSPPTGSPLARRVMRVCSRRSPAM